MPWRPGGGRRRARGAWRRSTGLRQAEPGEFTRRAFENGRIDLTEAEGLADLIEAETEIAAQGRARAGRGRAAQADRATGRSGCSRCPRRPSARSIMTRTIERSIRRCCAIARRSRPSSQHGSRGPRVEPLKDGVRVVVAGPPNAGKSSLLNAIAGQERAIVTDVPGTTRDHIEVPLALGGVPILLTDTAGLREARGSRSRRSASSAREPVDRGGRRAGWLGDPDDAPAHPRLISVHAKADLPARAAPDGSIAVSA